MLYHLSLLSPYRGAEKNADGLCRQWCLSSSVNKGIWEGEAKSRTKSPDNVP